MNQVMRDSPARGTFLRRLVAETEQQRNYLLGTEQIRRGLAGSISIDAYVQYLGEAFHHVRHTVPLMELTKSRLPAGREWLVAPLDDYVAEETGHEEWILDDIRNAGGNSEAVRKGKPRMATEFMVAYAYDYVNRINPVGFFGMVFVLESTSTRLATDGADALMNSLGLSADCFRYLTSHGALDLEHMRALESIMERIDHTEDRNAIVYMAQRIYVLFANLFRSIPLDGVNKNDVF
jgi:long-chain acyl-CoA synthetase